MHAFGEIGALGEVWLHFIPRMLGSGAPLARTGVDPLSLTLASTRPFPDGVVALRYVVSPT